MAPQIGADPLSGRQLLAVVDDHDLDGVCRLDQGKGGADRTRCRDRAVPGDDDATAVDRRIGLARHDQHGRAGVEQDRLGQRLAHRLRPVAVVLADDDEVGKAFSRRWGRCQG